MSGLLVMACVLGVHAHPRPPTADSVPGWLRAPRASRASALLWGPGPPVAGHWGSAPALHSAGPPRLETCARSGGAPLGALLPPFYLLRPGGGVRAGLASRFFLHHPSPMRRRWAWWLRAYADDDSMGAGCTGCMTLLSAPPSVRLVCGLGLVERAANPAVVVTQVCGGVQCTVEGRGAVFGGLVTVVCDTPLTSSVLWDQFMVGGRGGVGTRCHSSSISPPCTFSLPFSPAELACYSSVPPSLLPAPFPSHHRPSPIRGTMPASGERLTPPRRLQPLPPRAPAPHQPPLLAAMQRQRPRPR